MKYLTLLLLVMAFSCKKDQPIFCDDGFDCNPQESDYCIPVQQGDTSPIQFDLTELFETNLITNGTFASGSGWTLGTDWAISGGTANYSAAIPGTAITRPTDVALIEGYYLVKLDIITASGNVSLSVQLGGQVISIVGGLLGGGFESQTLYLFGFITPASNILSIGGALYDISIDNVEVYKLSDMAFYIRDCQTEEIFYEEEGSGPSIEYYETGDIADGSVVPLATQGHVIITLDWTTLALDEGCYCICFKDGGLLGWEFMRNGEFTNSDFWTITNSGLAGWAITGGQAVHTAEGIGGNDTIEQTLYQTLDPTLCYELSFDIIDATSWSITYQLLAGVSIATNTLTGSGNSTQTVSIDGGIGATGFSKLTFSVGNTNDTIIDNVSINVVTDCLECVTSNCISYKSNWQRWAADRKMCSIHVNGANENAAFGFAEDYEFKGRIFGVIRHGSYPDVENTEYKDLSGLKSLQYNDNEKYKELVVYESPAGVHDWLRLALRSQTLEITINGVTKQFIKKPGDYTPNWRQTSPDAPAIVEIQEVQQTAPNALNV